MEQTTIKIIDVNWTTNQAKLEESWVQDIQAEGVHVSFSENPCILRPITGSPGIISEIECKANFTDWGWKKVGTYPTAAAICISHMRALHEVMVMRPQSECIIILEGDVTSTDNTSQLLAAFLANWWGNKILWGGTKYVALSFSDWHSGYSQTLRNEAKVVPNSIVAPYFKLVALPMQKQDHGGYRYCFVGQGARAICYSKKFVMEILKAKIGNFWDLHLLDLLSHEANQNWKTKYQQDWLALAGDPPMFHHVPDFDKRFRGSGRMENAAVNAAEETSYYLTLSLTKEWGLCNRWQTICIISGICTVYRCGLYVLWKQNKACPSHFYELFDLDVASQVYQSMPFIKIFEEPTADWKAAQHNQHWCLANIEAQCDIQMGLNWFWKCAEESAQKNQNHYYLDTLIPSLKTRITEQFCWDLLVPKDDVYKAAHEYCQQKGLGTCTQVAIHCRRGDHRYMNCEAKLENQEDNAHEVFAQWEQADADFQENANMQAAGCWL